MIFSGRGTLLLQILTVLPRIEGGSIGLPSIIAEKAGRLEFSVHVHRPDRSDDDVICESVAPMSASAATASETVMTILCDLSPADATVEPHMGCSDAQIHFIR